ncbi:MAG: hypothetical protein J6K52_05360 [Clostridia bacterium]|nr:hypothetical protein [Clostridia bacterium]
MKKRLMLILLAVLSLCLAFSMVSCGDEEGSDGDVELDENGFCVGEHVYGEWTVTKNPTCQGDGEEARICKNCPKKETRDIKVDDKRDCDFTGWATALEPNCTEDGVSARICRVCDNIEAKPISALGHDYGDGSYTTIDEVTCTTDGLERRICRTCEFNDERVVPMLNHPSDKLDILEAQEPTETDEGWTRGVYCFACKTQLVESYIVPALGTGELANITKSSNINFWMILANGEKKLQEDYGGGYGTNKGNLFDGKYDTRSSGGKSADNSYTFEWTAEQYINSIKVWCNIEGTFKNDQLSIILYDSAGNVTYKSDVIDVSKTVNYNFENINKFAQKVEIVLRTPNPGGYSGHNYLYEVEIYAPATEE